MNERDLRALGFLHDDVVGTLESPSGSVTLLHPTGDFYELQILLPNGTSIVAVLSKSAVKITRDRDHG
jgi:hypothetical protein